MAKYEYHPVGFQPIPTPEEEAMEDTREKGNKHGTRAMAALCILMASMYIWSLFS